MQEFRRQYDCTVELATYNSADEAIAKLASGSVAYDVILGLSGSNIVNLMAQAAPAAAEPHLPAEPRGERLAGARGPLLRPGAPATRCRTSSGRTASAGATTRSARTSPAWTSPGTSSGSPPRTAARSASSTTSATASACPCSATRCETGVKADLNTEDPELVAKAGRDLQELTDICNIKVTITDYQTLPEGTAVLHHSWSGDLLAGAFYYMPEGVSPEVLSFWGPETGGVVQNDFLCITRDAESPVLAHLFLDFLLDEANAFQNFTDFNGYIPPQNGIDADALIGEGLIPESLARAVTRPDQFLANQELLQLTVEGERLWDDAWGQFRAG